MCGVIKMQRRIRLTKLQRNKNNNKLIACNYVCVYVVCVFCVCVVYVSVID